MNEALHRFSLAAFAVALLSNFQATSDPQEDAQCSPPGNLATTPDASIEIVTPRLVRIRFAQETQPTTHSLVGEVCASAFAPNGRLIALMLHEPESRRFGAFSLYEVSPHGAPRRLLVQPREPVAAFDIPATPSFGFLYPVGDTGRWIVGWRDTAVGPNEDVVQIVSRGGKGSVVFPAMLGRSGARIDLTVGTLLHVATCSQTDELALVVLGAVKESPDRGSGLLLAGMRLNVGLMRTRWFADEFDAPDADEWNARRRFAALEGGALVAYQSAVSAWIYAPPWRTRVEVLR